MKTEAALSWKAGAPLTIADVADRTGGFEPTKRVEPHRFVAKA